MKLYFKSKLDFKEIEYFDTRYRAVIQLYFNNILGEEEAETLDIGFAEGVPYKYGGSFGGLFGASESRFSGFIVKRDKFFVKNGFKDDIFYIITFSDVPEYEELTMFFVDEKINILKRCRLGIRIKDMRYTQAEEILKGSLRKRFLKNPDKLNFWD